MAKARLRANSGGPGPHQVTSAAFGSPDLATLHVICAWDGLTPAERAEQPHTGDIFACDPGVTGRPPFLFGDL